MTVRDLFIEALAMKVRDVPPPQIRSYLVEAGHDIGHTIISDVGDMSGYQLTFESTGEKISFDGIDYHFSRE